MLDKQTDNDRNLARVPVANGTGSSSLQHEEVRAVQSAAFQKLLHTEGLADASLEWGDVMFLEQNTVALRHVSTVERMQTEAAKGFMGDALAVSNIRNLVPPDSVPERVKTLEERFKNRAHVRIFQSDLSDEQKNEIIQRLSAAILSFIVKSYQFVADSVSRPRSIREAVQLMSGRDSFLIIRSNIGSAYDAGEGYEYLGKMGRRSVASEDILFTISADEVLEALPYSDADLKKAFDDAFWSHLSKATLLLLSRKVKAYRQQFAQDN